MPALPVGEPHLRYPCRCSMGRALCQYSLGGARRHHCWLLVARRRDSFEARRKLWPDDCRRAPSRPVHVRRSSTTRRARSATKAPELPAGQGIPGCRMAASGEPSSVPVCAGDSSPDARCAARDDALSERQQLNTQELECVLAALSARVDVMATIWYELPYHRTSGEPVPIGLAFGLSLSHSQIDALVQHPFVEKVEPWPGSAISQHVAPVPAPVECPEEVEPAAPKLDGITSIQNQGRRPVVIELRDDGVLPAPMGRIRQPLGTDHLEHARAHVRAAEDRRVRPAGLLSGQLFDADGRPSRAAGPPVSQAAGDVEGVWSGPHLGRSGPDRRESVDRRHLDFRRDPVRAADAGAPARSDGSDSHG